MTLQEKLLILLHMLGIWFLLVALLVGVSQIWRIEHLWQSEEDKEQERREMEKQDWWDKP